jgi:chromosomal replication initiation ATPase DnaA
MKLLLYLYGPNGAGKTRLLQMMEAMLAEQCESEGVICIGAEKLLAEMISDLTLSRTGQFLAKYADIENLLIDNYWVLARKPHAAGMLNGLFRKRQNTGKLTVVASDLPLTKIDNENEEIAELFAGAVLINLGSHFQSLASCVSPGRHRDAPWGVPGEGRTLGDQESQTERNFH